MGKESLFETSQKHGIELQPLRAVESHEKAGSFLFHGIQIGEQADAIEKTRDRRLLLPLLIIDGGGHQLKEVLDSPFGFHGLLFLERCGETALRERLLDQRTDGRGARILRERFANVPEGSESLARPCRDGVLVIQLGRRIPKREASLGSRLLGERQGGGAETTKRCVDRAQETSVVVRIQDQPQVGKGVFDLPTFVESLSSH